MDDVTPGSGYIVSLPSFREVCDMISILLEVSIPVRNSGAIVCLFDVLSAFKANFVIAVNWLSDSGTSWIQVRDRMEDPPVSEG